jgi:hypothetical protein
MNSVRTFMRMVNSQWLPCTMRWSYRTYQSMIIRKSGRWRYLLRFFFAWYLHRGVILTKNNLIKWNWHGSSSCVFCTQDKTIKHLFFQCSFAHSIWSVIQVASDLYTPISIANIFGNWLNGVDYKYMILLRVGAMALIWSLWLCRNDKVFNNKDTSLLQVIYRCTGTLRIWSQLHRVEVHDLFTEVCTRLEDMAMDLFSRHGWQHNLRIGHPSP